MSTLSNQKATTAALIEGYNAWDIEAILAPRAPDCLHQVLPASIKREPASNEEYRRTFVGGFGPLFKNFKVRFSDIGAQYQKAYLRRLDNSAQRSARCRSTHLCHTCQQHRRDSSGPL